MFDETTERGKSAVSHFLDAEKDARNSFLDELGLHGPAGKAVGSAVELAIGGTMVGLGVAASEVGIGIPVAGAGALLVADAVKGIGDDVLKPTVDGITNALSLENK